MTLSDFERQDARNPLSDGSPYLRSYHLTNSRRNRHGNPRGGGHVCKDQALPHAKGTGPSTPQFGVPPTYAHTLYITRLGVVTCGEGPVCRGSATSPYQGASRLHSSQIFGTPTNAYTIHVLAWNDRMISNTCWG